MISFGLIIATAFTSQPDVKTDVKVVVSYDFHNNPRPALDAFRRLVKAKAVEWPMKPFDVGQALDKTSKSDTKPLPDFKVNTFSSKLWQNACRIDTSKPAKAWLTSNQGIFCYSLFTSELLDGYAAILSDARISNLEINYPLEFSSLQMSQLRFAINKADTKFPNSKDFLAVIKQFYNPMPPGTEAGTARGLRGQGMRSVADSLRKLATPNLK